MFIIGAALLMTAAANAGKSEAEQYIREATIKVEFVIVKSTPSYAEAHRTALDASKRLGLKLDLRDLSPTENGGLSFPKASCEADGWTSPCYVARGRHDAGVYVSVEYSNAYSDFKPGLYLVIVASGRRGEPPTRKALERARSVYPDAYAKIAGVYMGCMH
jgi:hypothetical protein